MDLPFKTAERLARHTKELEQASYVQLSPILSSRPPHTATVPWIYAFLAQLKDATGVNMQLEVLQSMAGVAGKWDPHEIALARKPFAKLLRAVNAVKPMPRLLPVKLVIFEALARCLARPSPHTLTIAHIYLGLALTPATQRFSDPLFNDLKLDYDPRYGTFRGTMLSDYFAHCADLLSAWSRWELACIYAKCALATSNRREPLAQLYAKATILQLVAHRVAQKPLPGYISDVLSLAPESEPVSAVWRSFEMVSHHVSLRGGPQSTLEGHAAALCAKFGCESLKTPLCNAHKIAWLEALHTSMPRCLLEQVANSGDQEFDMGLLENGYRANVYYEGSRIIFEAKDKQSKAGQAPGQALGEQSQWATLESVVALTKRLSRVPKLAAAPQLISDLEHDMDDMNDMRF